jgi:MerR family transcriptional regulator/heat shock protein HspR
MTERPLPPPLPIDDHAAALYTVGQVADMLGVQPAFLRRLDAEGVVQPVRSSGGQRRYSRREIGQVQRVSAMAAEGLTLAGIRRLLVMEAELADLRRQLAELTALRPQGVGEQAQRPPPGPEHR